MLVFPFVRQKGQDPDPFPPLQTFPIHISLTGLQWIEVWICMKRRYRLNNYLVLERPIAQIGYAKEMLCFNLM